MDFYNIEMQRRRKMARTYIIFRVYYDWVFTYIYALQYRL